MQSAALLDAQSEFEDHPSSLMPVNIPVATVVLDATCAARPGLHDDIWHILKNSDTTVVEMVSRQFDAAMDSMIVFHATAALRVASDCVLAALQDDLEAIEPDLVVSISGS